MSEASRLNAIEDTYENDRNPDLDDIDGGDSSHDEEEDLEGRDEQRVADSKKVVYGFFSLGKLPYRIATSIKSPKVSEPEAAAPKEMISDSRF